MLNSNEPIIVVDNLTKVFPMHPQNMKPRGVSLFDYFKRMVNSGRSKKFFALQEVSFKIYPGEAVGIVGDNGAGKSTLLQILSGISAPSSGTVQINGRYGELFSLNSGFNMDLSGRKNIYLYAAIKKVPREKIESLMDKIINFSELGDFIDEPIKNYSSGMRGRLGFSIVFHVLPDIIFIDEALSTGDVYFRAKCDRQMEKMRQENRTLLLVTHGLGQIKRLCTRTIWMHNGRIKKDGETDKVLRAYNSYLKDKEKKKAENDQ